MSDETVNYEAVLADLEKRRATLDSMIEMVRQFLGQPGLSSVVSAISHSNESGSSAIKSKTVSPEDIPSDAFIGMNLPDAIRSYLGMVKRPQSVRAITDALERGGMQHTSQRYFNVVNATLHRLWEHQGDPVQIGKLWGLAIWYPGRKLEKEKQ